MSAEGTFDSQELITLGNCIGIFVPPAGSSDPAAGECVGFRDNPIPLESETSEASGFRFRGAIQFMYPGYRPAGAPPFNAEYSLLEYDWTCIGQCASVVVDTGGVLGITLWTPQEGEEYYSQRQPRDMGSSCPRPHYFPNDQFDLSASSDEPYEETSGAIIRVMSLHDLGVQSSEIPSSMHTGRSVPVYYNRVAWTCTDEAGYTMIYHSSELALELDHEGNLAYVYFGANNYCDENPCVWARDNPPPGKAGVFVRVMQFHPADSRVRLWEWHFDCTGKYMGSCHYGTLCNCFTDPPPSSESQPIPCHCRSICLVTGGCPGPAEGPRCPAVIEVDCEIAVDVDCEINPGSSAAGVCRYTWGDPNCCTTGGSAIEIPGPAIGSDPTAGCYYAGEFQPGVNWVLTCDTGN